MVLFKWGGKYPVAPTLGLGKNRHCFNSLNFCVAERATFKRQKEEAADTTWKSKKAVRNIVIGITEVWFPLAKKSAKCLIVRHSLYLGGEDGF